MYLFKFSAFSFIKENEISKKMHECLGNFLFCDITDTFLKDNSFLCGVREGAK